MLIWCGFGVVISIVKYSEKQKIFFIRNEEIYLLNASDETAKEILRLLVKPTQSSLGVVIMSEILSALSRRGILYDLLQLKMP